MILKSKVYINHDTIFMALSHDIYFNAEATSLLQLLEHFIYKKIKSDELAQNVHEKLNAIFNKCIFQNSLSLWARPDLPYKIQRDKSFYKMPYNELETFDIVKPIENITFVFNAKKERI